MLPVIETFASIQGESTHAGRKCFFIRLAQCNLRCNYCDTVYAWEGGTLRSVAGLVDEVITPYDHHNLSELPDFQEINPTSEVLARTIYRKMSALLNDGNVKVSRVRIGESASSRLTYSE